MIYYPPQILFLLRVHANCVRVHPSFSLSRLTEQPPFTSPAPLPMPSFCRSRRIVSPFARPLCSAPSLKVTDCLLYYPLVSIFTLLSRSSPGVYCSRGEFVRSQYGLEGLERADHCRGVVGSAVILTVYCDLGEPAARLNASNQPKMDRRITRLVFVLRQPLISVSRTEREALCHVERR